MRFAVPVLCKKASETPSVGLNSEKAFSVLHFSSEESKNVGLNLGIPFPVLRIAVFGPVSVGLEKGFAVPVLHCPYFWPLLVGLNSENVFSVPCSTANDWGSVTSVWRIGAILACRGMFSAHESDQDA